MKNPPECLGGFGTSGQAVSQSEDARQTMILILARKTGNQCGCHPRFVGGDSTQGLGCRRPNVRVFVLQCLEKRGFRLRRRRATAHRLPANDPRGESPSSAEAMDAAPERLDFCVSIYEPAVVQS